MKRHSVPAHGVDDLDTPPVPRDDADITRLTTTSGVEHRPIEEEAVVGHAGHGSFRA